MTLPTDERVVGRAALLLKRHGRRQAVDLVDLGHGHLVKQPPGIGRHRFQIAPLRLGVERAEGQRRLAGAGDAGEDHQRVARDVDVDVLEVVLPGPAHMHESGRFSHCRPGETKSVSHARILVPCRPREVIPITTLLPGKRDWDFHPDLRRGRT